MTEIEKIHYQLNRAFDKGSWIGPTVMSTLDGVTAHGAAMRPINNAHTIWELTNHIIFWENLVSRMIVEASVDTSAESKKDWIAIEDSSEDAWYETIRKLQRGHKKLADLVAALDDSRLADKSAELGEDFTVYDMLHGIIQHNIYHAGQIGMLKKSEIFPSRKAPLLNATSK